MIENGRSFMNNKNNVGPNIEPWGTPDNVWQKSDNPISGIALC